MTDWKERAERAEAELARLRALLTRAVDHVSYGSRRSYDGVGGYKMREAASQLLLEIMAALAALYRAAPPAQPAEQQAQTVCKRTLIEIDARLRECSIVGASAADAYDTFYQHMVETALAAQPAEPVQRLSDEQIDAILHEAGVDEFAAIPIEYDRQVARAIESALQPGWRDIESAPKDGTRIILGSSDGAWMAEYQPVYQSGYRPDNPWFSVMLNHAHMGRFPKAKPTHWQPIPPAPKATK